MGVGKTRLVGEICAQRFPGSTRLMITGYEIERVVPLGAANGLLNTLTTVPGEGPRLQALMDGTGPRP